MDSKVVGGSQFYVCVKGLIAWWMAIMFIFLKVCLMVGMGILKVSWSDFMEGMWVVTRTPAVIIIIDATF
jgi:hypothetical protein